MCRPGYAACPSGCVLFGRRQGQELTLGRRIRVSPGEGVNGDHGRPKPVDVLIQPAHEIVAQPAASRDELDLVDEWGLQSFPASDPPANW